MDCIGEYSELVAKCSLLEHETINIDIYIVLITSFFSAVHVINGSTCIGELMCMYVLRNTCSSVYIHIECTTMYIWV